MKKGYFIAPGRKRINPVLLAAIALAMAACSHPSESQFSLAPPPPAFDPAAPHDGYVQPPLMAFTGQPIPFPSHIPLSNSAKKDDDVVYYRNAALKEQREEQQECRIQDRFDRKAVLAYQWDNKRLSLDVDGLNLSDRNLEGVKLEYTMKLQPEKKSHKEKCRYESNWQGMIGSGYNEMFRRKENTVWGQIEKVSDDVEDALDKLF